MELLAVFTIFWLGIGICDEDSKGKVLYRPTLGRPVSLGMLYSAHSDNLVPGFGFWEESEISENKQLICHSKAETSFAYDESRTEKHNFLDVKAEIDISYNAGISVHVWGSASYLKHNEDISEKASVRLSYKSTTKTEAISTYLTNKLANSEQTSQACNWDKEGDVPTHVVSSITYGGDAHFLFEKSIKDSDESEKIHGDLHIAVEVGLFKISGSASFDSDKKDDSHMSDIKITTYTDFILMEQPTTMNDTVKLYKDISTHLGTKEDNFASSVPMSMTLIPLKRFCPETNQLAEEIAAHVMKIATDIRLELLDTDRKIEKLLRKRVAMENFRVKQLLLDFQEEVSNFTLTYEKNLQKLIIDARNPLKKAGANDLVKLVQFYKDSNFNFAVYLFEYLTQREREINSIDVLYYETVKKNEPQIAPYKAAKIPFALITGKTVFIVTLKVLPNFNKEKYSRYVEDKNKGVFAEKSKNKWFNDFNLVGAIGELWTSYKKFFVFNSYKEGTSFHVNLVQAESENVDMIATLHLYVYGKKQEGFKIPVQPEKPSVCRKERNRKMVVKVKNPQHFQGPSFINTVLVNISLSKAHQLKENPQLKTEHQIAKHDNETIIILSDLEPEESYNISVSYVTEFGSGEPSISVQSIGTLDNLRKTDGCIIDNDEKFKIGNYSTGQEINSIIECAKYCAEKDPNNVGWSYEFSTKKCFVSYEEYTVTEKDTETNETKTVKKEGKEFKLGWASGTIACSKASDNMTSCSKEDEGINVAFLVTGGIGNNGSEPLNSSEITLLGGESSCEIPDLPYSVHGHALFVTGDGIVASCGGSTSSNIQQMSDKCLVLDVGSVAWEENAKKIDNIPETRMDLTTVTLPIGVYMIGGYSHYGESGNVFIGALSTFFLPTGSSEWQFGPDIPTYDSSIGACAIAIDNDFLLIGGTYRNIICEKETQKCKERSTYSTSRVFQFDPLVNGPSSDVGWFTWRSLKVGRHHHGCAMLGNTVIVAGGYSSRSSSYSEYDYYDYDEYDFGDYRRNGRSHNQVQETLLSTEIIDLTTHEVTKGENLKIARAYFGMVTLGDVENQIVLVFGGEDSEKNNYIEKTKGDKWEMAKINLKVKRSNFGSVAVNVKSICRGAPVQKNQTNTTVDSCSGCMPWGKWEPCKPTCGQGKRIRTRSCKSNNGEGDTCQCKTEKEEECSIGPCPVDGSWSGWSSFSACSTTDPYTCGTKSRTRTCTDPVAVHKGKSCEGRDIEIVGCSGGNKLPIKVLGHCQENQGTDINIGQEAVDGCFAKPEDCLKTCQENGTATGCEFNTRDRNCYIHTAHITEVNRTTTENICWLFIVNEMPGSCTDNVTTISGNFTSEACLDSCQEKDDAQGCQYNIVKEECSYFTCPMLTASGNKNITCWTFNKGLFNGDQGTNCDN